MHELSIAVTMIEQIEQIMRDKGISVLDSITVTIGALSGVDDEAFEFAFPMAVEGTSLEGAKLCIVQQPVEVHCRNCQARTSPEPIYLRCLACGSTAVEIVSGRDLLIQSLEYTETEKVLAKKTP
jgi:hydrogenase nickel incorporation protein HypA/HybF